MALQSSSKTVVSLDISEFAKAQQLFEAVFSGKYRLIVYGGAVRGGKTYNMLGCLVLLLRQYPGARAAIIRKDLETLKRNTLPSCQKVFPPRFMDLVNSSSYIWKGNNDHPRFGGHQYRSEAFFFGENYHKDKELARWDGLEVNYMLLDQIEELQEASFSKAIERCGSYVVPGLGLYEQPKPIILASCNPTKNWVKRMIYDPYMAGTLPEDWLYIPATIDENPHIPKTYLDALERLALTNPEEYKRRRFGDWNYRSEDYKLYNSEALDNMTTNDYIQGGGRKYLTADIALEGKDKFTIGIWEGWRLTHVYTYLKSDGHDVLKEIQRRAREHRVPQRNISYDALGVGNYLKGWLKSSYSFKANARPIPFPGAKVRGKNKTELPNYFDLRSQCYVMMAEIVNEHELFISARGAKWLDELKEELEAHNFYNLEAGGKIRVTPKKEVAAFLGRSPDYSDMFVQRIVFALRPQTRSRTGAR